MPQTNSGQAKEIPDDAGGIGRWNAPDPAAFSLLFNPGELASMDTSRVERCLAKAQECERLAAQARDPGAKYTYNDIARQWRELAEQIRELAREAEFRLFP
jgi:hypothetical protein